ncbi:hypothetical protein BRADI_3g54774v3 [Brachypodium distachyon]|uniref:Uncharacterized protein n=1 Tax=Brachypodium distachyon TaxID=15368 RepID=A0A2K2D550_BRADI|nr:hypothetical protein BRADI_3g54774v3 [Brachypodium distachyon]
MNVQRIASQIKKKKKKRRKMASKAVFVAAVLIALVASASAGKLAHGRHLGWINGMKGDRLLACSHQRAGRQPQRHRRRRRQVRRARAVVQAPAASSQ